jgi:hypothetical protein
MREPSCRQPPLRFILKVQIGERLLVAVAHDEAGGAFLDRSGRREAARGCHGAMIANRGTTEPSAARRSMLPPDAPRWRLIGVAAFGCISAAPQARCRGS